MSKVELVARALAASRTGHPDDWRPFRADALLVLAAFGQANAPLRDAGGGAKFPSAANDR
jgi:hypothetical protein